MNTENAWTISSTENFTYTTTSVNYVGKRPVLKTIKFNNKHRCTENHAILINRNGSYQWLSAKDIEIGDFFIKFDKTEEIVSSKEAIEEAVEVVAIDCEIKDFYFANGILVHNITAPGPWVS
jgi:intein/homing endonuclease